MEGPQNRGDIVVIGAGLVGSLLAYLLQKKGFNVTVFERYQDIRQIPSLGRSINLSITKRGLRAVDLIGEGLREELLSLAVKVTGRILHQADGSVQFQRYGKDDTECNYSISRFSFPIGPIHPFINPSRFELNKFLIQKAESSGAKIFFGYEINSDNTIFADSANNNGGDVGSILQFTVTSNGEKFTRVINCRCPVVACDGGGSRARYAMRKDGLTEFTEKLLGTEK
jgi:kynurenine 3-monooxygenase